MGVNCSSRIEEYMNEVCGHIKFKEVHKEIKLELESHIYEIVDEYMNNGLSKEAAVEKAILQMGDSVTVGKQLNSTHKVKPDLGILVTVAVLLSVGLIALYSIEAVVNSYYRHASFLFTKTVVITIAGIAIGSLMYFFDYKKLKPFCKHIYLLNLLIITFITITGNRVRGIGYLTFRDITINYIYVSPWIFVISYAGILKEWEWDKFINSLLGIALLLLPFMIYLSNAGAVAVIYFTTLIVVAVASRVNLINIIMLMGCPLVVGMFFVMGNEYRIQRFIAMLYYKADTLGTGYMYVQCKEAIKSAGFFGKGFKAVLQVPETKTDFIFTYIVYSFGWIAGIIVVALAVLFIIRMVKVANMVKDSYGKIMIKGFIAIFGVQFVWNVLMNLGLAPIVGVGLPFISYGGSQLMASMAVVGIISSIFRRKNLAAGIA